jgi:hypothetical protein
MIIEEWVSNIVKSNPRNARSLLRKLNKAIYTGMAHNDIRLVQEYFPKETDAESTKQLIRLRELLTEQL